MKLFFEDKKRMDEGTNSNYLYEIVRQSLSEDIWNARSDGLTPEEIINTVKTAVKDILKDWFG